MAAFQLFVGGARGDAILRDKERLARPDDTVDLHAEAAAALDLALDPYTSHRAWSERALDELIAGLRGSLAAWTQAAIAEALRSLHRSTVEPWMDAAIAARVAADPRIATGTKVLALAEQAATETGTLLFVGD